MCVVFNAVSKIMIRNVVKLWEFVCVSLVFFSFEQKGDLVQWSVLFKLHNLSSSIHER